MPRPKKKFASFYRIFTKIVAIFFIVLLIHSFPFFSFFKRSAQVVHYQEYIRGEKNIGNDQGKIEEGAQTLAKINEIEKAILDEAKAKLQKKGESLNKNQELDQAKEKLDQAQNEHEEKKKVREKAEEKYKKLPIKSTDSFSPEEQKINDDYGSARAYEDKADEYRQEELKNVQEKVIKNIQNELKRADLAITDLNIEFTSERTWRKRSWQKSILLDPVRFFLIQPLQWISQNCGILSLSGGIFLDLLLKVLLMRLLLNWISYPPRLADLDLAKSREKSEPTDLASLEEEREIAKKQLEAMKQMFFNIAMSLLLITTFSLHPFAFDRSNHFFSSRQVSFLPWMLFYLVIFFFSQFIATITYQKISMFNYLRKSWLIIAVGFGMSWVFYTQVGRFGDYLFALLSEVINILISLVKIAYRRSKPPKKEKIKWERKKVWNYHNYKR
ncbi:hypothetical protein [endosymbiont GvMRE of Glomus versiforme]|uniref:hypothetical protein n=1 Tax=endosymbiont GvMRE of Glomus versiforme TaxID=2039283 RepID=UPI000ED4D1C5|nr:hypothetical protein [endosymbiont GvMRE of Glomus versiforme]RHZ36555.1 hypothetical protein GvMRE_I2g453 [endosymbiont GvMRE of Glomus versiforme]